MTIITRFGIAKFSISLKSETLETSNHVMQEPKQGNSAQHRRD